MHLSYRNWIWRWTNKYSKWNKISISINNNLFLKTHIESIKNKLNLACYVMRLVKPYVTANTLKVIYYSYFHSIMTYGLTLWRLTTTIVVVPHC